MPVTDSEKLLLILYRVDQALRELEYKSPPNWWQRLIGRKTGKRGVGWALAHHALQKGKFQLGLEMGPDNAILERKPEVKDIERRLFEEFHAGG